jgi:hypothetical protein
MIKLLLTPVVVFQAPRDIVVAVCDTNESSPIERMMILGELTKQMMVMMMTLGFPHG